MKELRYPIVEVAMSASELGISIKDDGMKTKVWLPKEYVEFLVTQWQAYQSGTATEPYMIARHYLGELATKREPREYDIFIQ